MDCKLVSTKLVQYLDEDLPPAIYGQVTDHLDSCYFCAEEYHELVQATDLARHMLRCPVYRDGFERLRRELRQGEAAAPSSDILFYPRRLRRLKSVVTAAGVAAAVAIFTVMVGLPAVEAVQAFDAAVSTQLSKDAPVAAPAQVRGHSLVAWSSQIRWAEKMSLDVREAPKAPVAQKQPAGKEPVTRALPAAPAASRMVLCDNAFSDPESSLRTPESVIVLA